MSIIAEKTKKVKPILECLALTREKNKNFFLKRKKVRRGKNRHGNGEDRAKRKKEHKKSVRRMKKSTPETKKVVDNTPNLW